MIKFKQLGKDGMPALPTNLPGYRQRWNDIRHFPDPVRPVAPEGYVDPAE